MELSRRDFLKASGAGIGGIFLLGALSDGVAVASPIKRIPLKKRRGETPTICPYDASGCGFIVEATEDGKVHQVGIPWHWGYIGLSAGASANELTPHVGDANTMIPEFKAFLVDVKKKA